MTDNCYECRRWVLSAKPPAWFELFKRCTHKLSISPTSTPQQNFKGFPIAGFFFYFATLSKCVGRDKVPTKKINKLEQNYEICEHRNNNTRQQQKVLKGRKRRISQKGTKETKTYRPTARRKQIKATHGMNNSCEIDEWESELERNLNRRRQGYEWHCLDGVLGKVKLHWKSMYKFGQIFSIYLSEKLIEILCRSTLNHYF